MIRIERSVVIAVPVEQVFEYVSHFENGPLWRSAVRAVYADPGTARVGTSVTEVAEFLGRRVETHTVVSEYEPNRKLTFTIAEGPVAGQIWQIFEPAELGTKLTGGMDLKLGRFFGIAEPAVGRMIQKQVEMDLETLKHLLEKKVTKQDQ